tara:strand:+ start:1494 stop:2066 length:573 start_codon:yes stop_codon:yes gene_type:complete
MAKWEKVVTGGTYETVTVQKRYSGFSSSIFVTGYTDNSTASSRVYGLSTNIPTGGMPGSYSDTSSYGWPIYRSPVFIAMQDCTVDGFGGFGEQAGTNMDVRLVIWKHTPVTSNSASADGDTTLDNIGFIDYDAAADTSSLHEYRDGTIVSSAACSLNKGDSLHVMATAKPGNTGIDSTYWYLTTGIRIKY